MFTDYILDQFVWGEPDESIDGSNIDAKQEKIYNFLNVPYRLELMIMFGVCVCLSSVLFHLIILPVRVCVGILQGALRMSRLFAVSVSRAAGRRENWGAGSYTEKHECMKLLIMILSAVVLHCIDLSKLYHSIRGQNIIKLYVIYNVCEVLDKLCCSFGLDVLNSIIGCSRQSKVGGADETGRQRRFGQLTNLVISVAYCTLHSLVLLYQIITLNVAVNSHSNALLTLLLSNQFVEIKSAVFKKFEKENLFQLACSEIVERLQIVIYCLLIGWRNILQVTSAECESWLSLFNLIFFPLLLIYVSELGVDWLKHSFITKFNGIPPEVYDTFIQVLCNDFRAMGARSKISSKCVSTSSKIGHSPLPICCLVIRASTQIFFSHFYNIRLGPFLLYACSIFILILIFKFVIDFAIFSFVVSRGLYETSSGQRESSSNTYQDHTAKAAHIPRASNHSTHHRVK